MDVKFIDKTYALLIETFSGIFWNLINKIGFFLL